MNTKTIYILVILIISFGGFVYYQNTDKTPETLISSERNQDTTAVNPTSASKETLSPASSGTVTKPSTPTPTPTTGGPKTFTMADIRAHNTESSCWTTVNGSVYDVTAWINRHPGGSDAILSLCGGDGSAAFDDQHGGQRRPASELATFKIGALAQ